MAKKELDSSVDLNDAKKEKVKKASANKNSKKSDKVGFFKRIKNWFHDLKVEFRKVTWPTKKTVINHTSVVVGVIIVSSIFIGLLDEGLLKLVELLIDLGN